jgi:hypothetical protein
MASARIYLVRLHNTLTAFLTRGLALADPVRIKPNSFLNTSTNKSKKMKFS